MECFGFYLTFVCYFVWLFVCGYVYVHTKLAQENAEMLLCKGNGPGNETSG